MPLGSSESLGPDSQILTPLAWTGSTWSTSGNAAINTPTLGSDVIVNGAFAADTDWNKGTGWAIGSGTANATTASADLTATVAPLIVGRWYQVQYTVSGFAAGTVQVVGGGISLPTHAANGTYIETFKATTTAFLLRGVGFTGSIDNVSAKLLTTAELFATVPLSIADIFPEVGITLSGSGGGGLQAGLVFNLDSANNPQNFIIAYLNGNGFGVVEECVAGIFATKFTTSLTYAANGVLRVAREGTQLRCFYNGGTLNSLQTMSVNVNTLAGMFSTSALNSLDNFLIWSRGTSNAEYAALGNY